MNKSIKISHKEKILGNIVNSLINMCILNSKIIIYRIRQDCNQMKLIEDL